MIGLCTQQCMQSPMCARAAIGFCMQQCLQSPMCARAATGFCMQQCLQSPMCADGYAGTPDQPSAAASRRAPVTRTGAKRWPGLRPSRSIGPDRDNAPSNTPPASSTGADTDATPASRCPID